MKEDNAAYFYHESSLTYDKAIYDPKTDETTRQRLWKNSPISYTIYAGNVIPQWRKDSQWVEITSKMWEYQLLINYGFIE